MYYHTVVNQSLGMISLIELLPHFTSHLVTSIKCSLCLLPPR
uniref:Uncharacterized protein n=1 Tax=Setaria italica TaxID=4555 RepID=K3YNJ5_SETIT